ncbi:protein DpdE [Paraburkholderia sp. BL9I2N2]|uniref:protein DpdE n=1 Tax=Paraburkholderia sp. BL9I2N2 TaxID=1938809 RepID=UPI0010DA5AA6|nr:protein DpdE [Paraburkholderia sp. BL9I2N2]TCK97106.1 ATP-dependent helicase HepA [Paraburkholderia sp. BL9I2N2]
MPAARPEVGAFVQITAAPYSAWGIGKFAGATNGIARVQYFDTPGAEPQVVESSLTNIKSICLPTQTRVFRRQSTGRWQVGRVTDGNGAVIFVQFPNGESANVEAADLQVRWNRPLRDPLPLLTSEATETPFLADARSAFTRQVALQYRAASGITAALSSSIELVDYQFEVVRRVLTDPVQRYLLADEVGLGKTIEAGVIIRQFFLDTPPGSSHAVVLAPPALVAQWREELTTRFGLGNNLDDFLHVVSHEDVADVEDELANAGLLVVDEAHHLSRFSSEHEITLYRRLKAHAHRIPRLLLLSATPVLSDPKGFLRVLHLLDPVAFPLDDLDGFKRRIATRQVVAEVVAMLTPENLWSLTGELDRLQDAYGEDITLMEKVDALRAILNAFPDEEDEAYVNALADLKTHLVESYRLHRRILRNRRKSLQWATPRRAGLKRVPFRSAGAERWRRQLEELRLHLNGLDTLPATLRAAVLGHVLNSRDRTPVRKLLEQHNIRDDKALEIADALDDSAKRMRDGQERLDALTATLEGTLATPNAQVVVFCSDRADADRAAQHLQRSFGAQVVRHEVRANCEDEDTPLPWQKFLSTTDKVRVLVCDARAEEGVNLHGGKKIAVHFDMPGSPNRCEQRLGRLDRFGKGDPIVSYALHDESNPDEGAWIDTLDTGWQVFNRSVASLQYLIESALQTLEEEWFAQGTPAIREHATTLSGPMGLVERERKQIDHQDGLDALGEQELDAMEQVDECDQSWRDWRAALIRFAGEALKFQVRYDGSRPINQDSDEAFRLAYVMEHGVPRTLIPMGGYLRTFLQSIDVDAPSDRSRSPLTYRYVFRRQNALTRAARSQGVRVLRVGDPLVASLEAFCEQDDRGRAFAMWRVDREYEVHDPSGADLFFRFDFIIRPAALVAKLDGRGADGQSILEQSLTRKSQALLAPMFLRIWVDGSGAVVSAPSELMEASYVDFWQGTRHDFNLNPRRWRDLPSPIQTSWLRDWPALCAEARQTAEAAALQSDACRAHVRQALAALDGEERLRRAQTESRLARLTGAQRRCELEERSNDDALCAAIRNSLAEPDIDLDVAGAVFLASEDPFEQ